MLYGNRGDLLLFKAIEQDDREILELLIAYGINIHAKNSHEETALQAAERQNKPHATMLIRAELALETLGE